MPTLKPEAVQIYENAAHESFLISLFGCANKT